MKNTYGNFIKRALRGFLFATALALTSSAAVWGADSKPCGANSASRELDYWLGEWTVSSAGSSTGSTSKVSLSLDGCLFVESWTGGEGHAGQTMLGYSEDDKRWYGMFADNEGRVHIFTEGKVGSGTAEFEGPSGPSKDKVLNRIKLTRLNPDRLEQTWEKSSDNGRSWKSVFRGEYSRSKP